MKHLDVNLGGWLVGWLVVMMAWTAPAQTQLGLAESPGGSGFYSNVVSDTLSATGSSNGKTWLVELEGGDRLTVWVATDKTGTYPRLRLRNAGGTLQASHDGTQQGEAMIQNYAVSTPGSYSLQVYTDHLASDFRMRVDLGRGFVLEAEPNDSEFTPSVLTPVPSGGGFTAKAAGALMTGADYHDLGTLSAGNAVNINLGLPATSSLQAGDVEMVLFRKGSEASPLATTTGVVLNATVVEDGEYLLRVRINPALSGHALRFDGGDDEISLGNPEALRLTGDQTIEMWIRPDDFAVRRNPWNKAYGGEGTMTLETDGTLNYFYGTAGNDTNPYQTFHSGRALPAGQWSHIAVVRQLGAEPRKLSWYFNGRLVNEAAASYFPAVASALSARIGSGYAGRFRGLIDEVRVWNVARSGAEIAAGMTQTLNGNEAGLVAYYPFAEGAGSVVGDATANALDGTVAGEAEWQGAAGVGSFSSARQGLLAQYVAAIAVTDAAAPQVIAARPLPVYGHVFEGIPDLLVQPTNLTAYRGQNGSSFTVQVTGGGGSVWGSGVYTDDSSLAAAARHAGLLANGETGLVTATILPGQGSYTGTPQNGVNSGNYSSFPGSYSLSAYTGPAPVLNAVFAGLRVDFSERMLASTLQNSANVELRHAGADATFDTADDSTHTLATSYDGQSTRVYFTVGDEPLQPGLHRLRLTTGVQDRGGNPLAAVSDTEFSVSAKAPFVIENRANNSRLSATPLSAPAGAEFDRSFTYTHDLAIGSNPHRLKLLDLDGDGIRDAIVAAYYPHEIRVYPGLANGSFSASSTNYATGTNPWGLELIDFDNDGRLDVVVGCTGGDQIRLHRNVGDGTLAAAGSVAVGDGPVHLVKGHFNGDSHLDLAVANHGTGTGGRSLSILLADGMGGFTESKVTVEGNVFRPYGLAAGDVNGDGDTDLVAGDYDTDQVRVFTGNGDGSFNTPVGFAMDGTDPTSIGLADFDHDGHLDLMVAAASSSQVAVLKGNGDGSFQAFATWPLGSSATQYFAEALDVDSDGWTDLVIPRTNGLVVLFNQRSMTVPSFTAPFRYDIGYAMGAALADVNGDGRPDFVVNEWNSSRLRTLLGNARVALSPDPDLARLGHAHGRGRILDGDEDWFAFSLDAPKRVVLACDSPLNPAASGINYNLYNADGLHITGFNGDYNGRGQTGQLNLLVPGTYYLRVAHNYGYTGEYRFRVSAFDPPVTIESEGNDTIGQADSIEFALGTGTLTGAAAGYADGSDGSGDFWALGNLGEGTVITLDLRLPQSSPLTAQVQLFKADGTQVAASGEGELQLVHNITAGNASAYFFRVLADAGTRGLHSEYLVDATLADPEAPFVTAVSLPAEASTVSYVAPNFTVSFSEDMLASTVVQAANYELRSAGPDAVFDTGDDIVYSLVPQAYSAGLTASFHLPDGPLQPGNYRFRAGTGLTDKFANPLAAVYTRLFTVAAVPGFVLESRDNNSLGKATPISVAPSGDHDGSFSASGTAATGNGPWGLQLLDLDGDGHEEAIVALYNAAQLAVLPGNGDGTFGAAVTYACGSNPWDVELIDADGDARLDIVVSCRGSDQVRVYTNPGDGTLVAGAVIAVGDGPLHLVKGNFNGDAIPDLAVVNHLTGTGGRSLSLLFGDGAGSFTESKITVDGQTVQFYALTAGDFNGDGLDDLAAGDWVLDDMGIFLNTGGGNFAAPVFYPVDDTEPTAAGVADFDGDGHLDLVVGTEYHDRVSLLKGVGDGSFEPFTTVDVDGNNYMYSAVQTPDIDGDGRADLLVSKYNGVVVCFNRSDNGSMAFSPPVRYDESDDTGGVAWADLNGDGCTDLVAASYNLNRLQVWTGNADKPLADDGAIADLRHGAFRGHLTTDSDVDWFSFSARALDRLLIRSETADGSGNSGRSYNLYNSAGTHLGGFSAGSSGFAQWSTTLAQPGTYYLRVTSNWGGSAEYRVRLTLAPPPTFVEAENNNSLSEFNTPPLALAAGSLTGTVLGVNLPGDTAGDYFNLGNLTPGTQVTVSVTAPQLAVDRLDSLELRHRWSFGEAEGATEFTDSVTGLASAELRGSGATVGGGTVVLPGGSSATAPYVDLPNGLVSSRSGGATIEGWAVVNGSQSWSRLFDFGRGSAGELLAPGGSADGQEFLYLSAQNGGTLTSRRLAIHDGRGESGANFSVPYQAGELFHFAVAYESRGTAGGTLRCYRNGVLLTSFDTANQLAAIDDVNNWLGRSQWTTDGNLNGAYSEFRVWDGAYSDAQAVASAAAGPDALAVPVDPAQAAQPYLTLFKADGQQMAQVAPGAGPLQFTLDAGDAASYRLRVHSNQRSTAALYQVAVSVEDVTPPLITSNSLPAEDSVATFPPPVFTLGFSEDMLASSVRDAAHYELRSAGPNGVFDDGDDVLYTLVPANYTSGLTTTIRIIDGPLQAGAYRFTAGTGLRDLFERPLDAAHVRRFSIEGVPGYVTEGRDNGSIATADILSGTGTPGAFDGSYAVQPGFATGGSAPISLLLLDLNGDGEQDWVVSNRDSDTVVTRLGAGDGTFGEAVTYAAGDAPHYMALIDFDKDGLQDVVVPNLNSDNVSVFRNVGDGTLALHATLAAGDGPLSAAAGDFNGDGNPDFAVTNHNTGANGRRLSVFLGDGLGAFSHGFVGDGLTPGWRPYHLAVADFDGNGLSDIAAVNHDSNDVLIFLATGAGSFSDPQRLATDRGNPTGITVADFNGDFHADLMVCYDYYDRVNLLAGNGDGSFQSPQNWYLDSSRTQYQLRVGDLTGDGYPDLLAPRWGALVLRQNKATPVLNFNSPVLWTELNQVIDVAVADLDGDGSRDLIALSHDQAQVRVYKGQGGFQLAADSQVTGLRHGYGRGQLDTSSDHDYYQFSARAGERLIVAAETPGAPSSSGFDYNLYDHRGTHLLGTSSSASNGYAYTAPYTLPFDGRFYLRVSQNYYSTAEYRFRVSTVDAQTQIETESNNSTGAATAVSFSAASGSRSAKVFGHLAGNDSFGDYWRLGNLAGGTQINVTLNRPQNSSFTNGLLRLLDAGGNVVAVSEAGGLHVAHTVAGGAEGQYYLRLTEDAGNRNLHCIYQLNLSLTDALPPQITGTSLPEEGGSTLAFLNSFTLAFNEDMQAVTVTNAANYQLLEAGPDQVLGTSDDVSYAVAPAAYSSGLSASYNLAHPLPPGQYRLTVSSLKDTYGNNLPASFIRHFTVAQLPGFTTVQPGSGSIATATPLVQVQDPAGLITGAGRGRRTSSSDTHFWSFNGTAGQGLTFDTELVGASASTDLYWRILRPDASVLWEGAVGNNNQGLFATLTLNTTGLHHVQVSGWDNWQQEYRFRLSLIDPALVQIEAEANNNIASATPLTFTLVDDISALRVAGIVHSPTDLDYFHLGALPAGKTLFVSVAQPATSSFLPVVAVYNAAGQFINEVNGAPGDGSAEVRISTPDDYYLLVRSTGATGNYMSQYVADVQVHETSSVAIPNLQVTAVDLPPESNLKSGDSFTYAFTVTNVGSADIAAGSWSDRLVLSANLVFGDADDTEIGVFVRNGGLAMGASYTVTGTAELPAGAVGGYHLIARTDIANQVDEVILENDNTSATEATFPVTLAPYPNLVVQNLAVTGPVDDVFSLSWDLANTGNLGAPDGFKERVRVVNTTTGAVVLDELRTPGALAATTSQARTAEVTATAAGVYQVTVTADALSEVYEHDGVSHAAAEANSAQAGFTILQYWTIAVSTPDSARGAVSGGGTFLAGTPVTVTAVPNTSVLPYQFVRWTQNGVFVSASPNYTFPAAADRQLVAEFALPTYQVSAQVTPAGAGSVTGTGFFAHGASAQLTATPSQGYLFGHWLEDNVQIGTEAVLNLSVTGPRILQAVFVEANPIHEVVTATQPPGLGVTAGDGTFTNGQSSAFSASASIEDGDTEYVFDHWKLNGVYFGNQRQFNKTFSTLDAPVMNFTAHYTSRSLKPVVIQVVSNYASPVRAATDVRFTLTFDRPMNPAVLPVLELASANAPTPAVLPAGGEWLSATQFRSAATTFGPDNGGAYNLDASAAADTLGRVMAAASVFAFDVDVTPPVNPLPVLGSTTVNSATIQWSDYAPPADLNAFRVYLQPADFSSTAGLTAVGGLGAAPRSYTFTGLQPDTSYYAAVAAVDTAGNSAPAVTAVPILLASTLPPPVALTLTAPTPQSARLDWSAYDTTALIGFQGWRVYVEEAPFTDVSALTPVVQLAAGVKVHQLDGLDRSKTYHIAVVGYNRLDEFNPAVTPQVWSDPLAGQITSDLTLGAVDADLTLDVLQSMVVKPGATLTVRPGTTLRFAAGTGLTIEGDLVAEGTPLRPIHFTSAASAPAKGDWQGVLLSGVDTGTRLSHLWLSYGRGLQVAGGSPQLGPLFCVRNEGQGLGATGNAQLEVSGSFFAFNDRGVRAADSALVSVTGSVVRTNSLHDAELVAGAVLDMQGNWWGSSLPADIAARVAGAVDTGSPLAGEPVLATGFAVAGGLTSTGVRDLPLQLASANAVAFRLSEDSLFPGVLWQDIFPAGETDTYSPRPLSANHLLSAGAGLKTVFVQFRSLTGQTSPALPVDITLITTGPAIQAFSLTDGQVITRPLAVTGSATAALGLDWLRFYVGDELLASSAAGSLNFAWDMRALPAGPVRARLLARDRAGNESAREVNVQLDPQPPPAPVITAPLHQAIVATSTVTVSGTAEPGVSVRLSRNGAPQGSTAAAPGGAFSFANVPLVEGANSLVATAEDGLGTRASAAVSVTRDSGPPAAVVLEEPPVYDAFRGLVLRWGFAPAGERPVKYRVLWHNAPFTEVAQASGQSALLDAQSFTLTGAADGDLHLAVVGYDAAGNASPLSNVIAYRLDRTAPNFLISYDKGMPAGPGPLTLVLEANEPLAATPLLTIKPNGLNTPISVPLTKTSGTTYTATFNVTQVSARTGAAVVQVTGQDLTGNRFSGSPGGTALSFDVTPPTATLSFDRPVPIKTVSEDDPSVPEDVNLSFNLTLSEAPKPGTTPGLTFTPPIGADVVPVLSGSGVNWTGSLLLTAAMGKGQGQFVFTATDARDNAGTSVNPNQLEIYNTEHPNAPGIPVNLRATTLAGGHIRIQWNAVNDAHSYRIYREPGNTGVTPVVRVADGIATTEWIDETVPADGIYRYAVRAFRVSVEGNPSGTLNALSDRTPPNAPEQPAVELTQQGLRVTWDPPSEGELPHHYHLYRNGVKIRTVNTAQPVLDFPPKGLLQYEVAAADAHENESRAAPVAFEFFVDAVDNLLAQVNQGQPTILTWSFDDPAGVGYHVYRNGVRQTGQPIALATRTFTDLLPLPPSEAVDYRVTAVDNQAREGAPRTVRVLPVTWTLLMNPDAEDVARVSRTRYFDNYRLTVRNNDATSPLQLGSVQVSRTLGGGAVTAFTQQTPLAIAATEEEVLDIPVPGAEFAGQNQSLEISVRTAANEAGSQVAYAGHATGLLAAVEPPLMVEMRVQEPPVAGGLADVRTRLHNRGYTPMQVVLGRQTGQQPGDLYLQVLDESGAEISRRNYNGFGAPGLIVRPNGDAYVEIEPGASVEVTVDDVPVPIVLAETGRANFRATVGQLFSGLGTANERVSGPLTGTLQSSVVETPYYGSVSTEKDIFSGDEPIVITGQAIDRASSNPQGSVPMRIGFAARGAVWYEDIEADAEGNFSFSYTPLQGFAGELTLWAAHPDVFDVLAQKTVRIYRLYATPSFGNIRMSKNDHLDFTLNLINPGELPLSGVGLGFRAYRLDGDGVTEIPIPEITCAFQEAAPAGLGPNRRTPVNLRLAATAEAPDQANLEITFTTTEGASAKFTGTLELLPAVPILSMTSPRQGFVDVTVNKGQIVSQQVTVQNLGTRALTGVELVPPKIVPWMQVNLPVNGAGNVDLPDLDVGATFTFTVAFVPPADTPQGYAQDVVKIRGSNAAAGFDFNVFALVSSDAKGDATFHVENFLGQEVPNASVRIRNGITGQEVGPLVTDANGDVSFTQLTEGQYSWNVTASGHSTATGTLQVVPAQTAIVEPVLQRSLVTVTFQVRPVPFTDRYEIVIEQTFETFVPAPVLVFTPPKYDFTNVRPGFETTVIYELKNHGLIKIFNVEVSGTYAGLLTMEPLIDFIPELLPQQTVQVPCRVRLGQALTDGEAGGCDESLEDWIERRSKPPPQIHPDGYVFGGPSPTIGNFIGGFCPTPNLADFINGLSAIASLGADGCFQSQQSGSLGTAAAVALAAAVVYETVGGGVYKSLADVAMEVASALGQCAAAHFAANGPGNGGSGGSGPGRGNGNYGVGGNGCFTADTPVRLADGRETAIASLKPGDTLAIGPDPRETAQLRHLYTLESDELLTLSLRVKDEPAAPARELRVTGEHLVWRDGRGWTHARELRTGDWLHGEDGAIVEITAVKPVPGTHRVYTLQLKGGSTFYAGGVLVQDLCGGLYLEPAVLSKLQPVQP